MNANYLLNVKVTLIRPPPSLTDSKSTDTFYTMGLHHEMITIQRFATTLATKRHIASHVKHLGILLPNESAPYERFDEL